MNIQNHYTTNQAYELQNNQYSLYSHYQSIPHGTIRLQIKITNSLHINTLNVRNPVGNFRNTPHTICITHIYPLKLKSILQIPQNIPH
ncbi:hypothetical protein Hanom_Chr14g01323491 [Helianthus anomalus]